MYCQDCGNEIRQNLNYCNRCGARQNIELEKIIDPNVLTKQINLVKTLSLVTGLVGITGVIAVAVLINQILFQDRHVTGELMLMLVVTVAPAIVTVYLLIRQIDKINSQLPPVKQRPQLHDLINAQTKHEIDSDDEPSYLSSASVIERTTRTLEEVPLLKHDAKQFLTNNKTTK